MSIIEAIILGIVQGLTEFLPVSSSGHLELASSLLGATTSENLLFSIIVHAATALSTIVIFRKDILAILTSLLSFKNDDNTHFALKLILSAIPVSLVGFLLKDHIEELFGGNILLVGIALLFTAGLLLLTYFSKAEGEPVKYWHAIVIGLAQAVAIFPGVSRSGTTIATALLAGVDKAKAARFSFLMALIPILGAALLETIDYINSPEEAEAIGAVSLGIGFLAAFLTGLFACQLMIRIVKRGKLTWFALYCAIVGLIAIGSTFI